MSERLYGVVKWFKDEKGYGFIRTGAGTEHFVHYSGIAGEGQKRRTLLKNQPVSFTLQVSPRGEKAVDVRPAE